ncbi:class I SAM-dependent methyltransferase [Variovorax sp. UMC13]|uniref:class I SAM-dependent methyltransferase n=1 Tax=Variovorax sp. UMC13 TaxID=1862326 RepID=UPI0016045A7E|nr:methyltransferase domain-containing protein [Variovorax sp. UMC13]
MAGGWGSGGACDSVAGPSGIRLLLPVHDPPPFLEAPADECRRRHRAPHFINGPSFCARVQGREGAVDRLARARAPAARLAAHRVVLKSMNAERVRFPDASFHCVSAPYVLSVTPRPAEVVREIRRVCKPGGTIVVLRHLSGSPAWYLLKRAVLFRRPRRLPLRLPVRGTGPGA